MSSPGALNDFIVESREHLQSFEQSLLDLEKARDGETTRRLIDEAFRVAHSLKGNSAFFGLTSIRELAHAAESVLEYCRVNNSSLENQTAQGLLIANDRLRAMIESVGTSSEFDNRELIQQLMSYVSTSSITESNSDATAKRYKLLVAPSKRASIVGLVELLLAQDATAQIRPDGPIELMQPVDEIRSGRLNIAFNTPLSPIELQELLGRYMEINAESLGWSDISDADSVLSLFQGRSDTQSKYSLSYRSVDLLNKLPERPILLSTYSTPVPARSSKPNTSATQVHPSQELLQLSPKTEDIAPREVDVPSASVVSNGSVAPTLSPQDLTSFPPAQSSPAVSAAITSQTEKATSIRITVELLDSLMNLVGELTIVRNQTQATLGEGEDAARTVAQRLSAVTSELQDTVLKTRMQPVGNLFGRFPRMVRDLARQLGKQVEINFLGQEVELDKSVLEQLSDPLTHLIRNSIDHGIELPDVRTAKGKQPTGKVTVAAKAGDGQVHIEIKDDGRGLDPVAIRAKVVALGLKTESELQKLSSKEIASFILLPGFSTAAKVTDVSGRGVGMDVVKTNIERLEGSLSIDSEQGIGTTILLRVPLTLAIVPCLIVRVGSERMAIPQRAIEEIVCIYPGSSASIESTHNAEYVRLRQRLVPVARMNEVIARKKPFNEAVRAEIATAYAHERQEKPGLIQYVLILNASGQRYGLLVDDVNGTEEVVVKPMHPSLKKVSILSGATLMGDGGVALIASAEGIAAHCGCAQTEKVEETKEFRDPAEVHRVLLFEYGSCERFALPLIQIRRVETIRRDRIEHVGQQRFANIGGISTRLVFLDDLLDVSSCELPDELHVIMPKFVVEAMGIVASRIVDTESMSIELQEASVADPGVLGTALIRDKLCLFLDTQYLRDKTFTTHLGETIQKKLIAERDKHQEEECDSEPIPESPRVLLIDDTPFFREIVRRYLESQGMIIVTAIDGRDGLKKCFEESFDLVVSDIEMPIMNGWEFCEAARGQGYQGPMIALTSLSKREHESHAKDCGFDAFEEKLDHDRLIGTVKRTLAGRRSLISARSKSGKGGAK